MKISLTDVSARGHAERGKQRPALAGVTFEAERGILAIVGAPKDGTGLVFDVLDGTVTPSAGHASAGRVFRVSLEAPLPEVLHVREVCALAGALRVESARPAEERLDVLGVASLAERRVRTLSLAERRTVTLALALTSRAEALLVEEPFVALDPVAPRLVAEALHARAAEATILVTTASRKDALALTDRIGVLAGGRYTRDAPRGAAASLHVVVASASRAALASALGGDPSVTHVATTAYANAGALLVVRGPELGPLARAVTRAIAASHADVVLIEAGQ